MVIIYCEASIAPEKQSKYIEKLNESGIVAATNTEPGNISYELLCSPSVPGKMFIVERWENPSALPAHMRSKNFKALTKLNAEYGVKATHTMYEAKALN